MTKKIVFTVCCCIAFACSKTHAQSDSLILNRNIRALQTYVTDHPIEKVHLHLDRPWYGIGDTIWFKAYVVDGPDHHPTALSSVLYVELINEKDSILKRLTLKLNSGTSIGDFILSPIYNSGIYRIRAYTNWMRNAGPDYFFDQKVVVAGPVMSAGIATATNAQAANNKTIRNSDEKPDLQFFPEGGDLVDGLRSKVAFKAINKYGQALDVRGTIWDTDGHEVASFGTQHLGMGQFPLTPQKGKHYVARVTGTDGGSFDINLPAAKNEGYALTVNNNNSDSLYVTITANDALADHKRDTAFYLIAQSGGKVYFAANGKVNKNPFSTQIPKDRFPAGIVQFTLFSQSGEPLNERVVFVQNQAQLDLSLDMEKESYAPGEEVMVDLTAKNEEDNAVAGTFSVAVTNETKLSSDENDESTIFTDLLLRSELTGHIEKPNYYFTEPTEKTRSDLDLLMLTQGYRRFEWKKIIAGNKNENIYQPEMGLSVTGIIKTPGGKIIPGGRVILTSTKELLVQETTTDATGRFSFKNLDLADTSKTIINAKKANDGNNVKISIIEPSLSSVNKDNTPPEYVSGVYSGQMKQAAIAWKKDSVSRGILLREVNIKSSSLRHNIKEQLKASANLNGPGLADAIYIPDRQMVGSTITACLAAQLNSVIFSGGYAYDVNHRPPLAMLIYVDGHELSPDWLDMLNPDDIYSVEALLSPVWKDIYGSRADGGVLVITTKSRAGIPQEIYAPKGLLIYSMKGYYKARSFYSPKYIANDAAGRTNNRTTVYWDPNVTTGEDGKASFGFFNTVNKGDYRIVIEGIDGNGKLGRQVLKYKVE